MNIGERECALAAKRLLSLLRLRKIQELEHLLAGRHAVHGNMEIASESAHGEEEVDGEKDDPECAGEIQDTGPQTEHG